MSKTREDLLISPGQPISSPNCWWAACSKADINIVAMEEVTFMHWYRECDPLGSDKVARIWPQGYSLQITTPSSITTENLGSVHFRWATQMRWHPATFLQTLFSGILFPLCSPWPPVTLMDIHRVWIWIEVCPYEVTRALQVSFLEEMATQLFEVNIMIQVVVLYKL